MKKRCARSTVFSPQRAACYQRMNSLDRKSAQLKDRQVSAATELQETDWKVTAMLVCVPLSSQRLHRPPG